jgi:hypothetical protein
VAEGASATDELQAATPGTAAEPVTTTDHVIKTSQAGEGLAAALAAAAGASTPVVVCEKEVSSGNMSK